MTGQDLKNAILQAAMIGKLMNQWQAATENNILYEEKEIDKSLVEDLPIYSEWHYFYLEDIADIYDCPHSTPAYISKFEGYLCLRTKELKPGLIEWDKLLFLNKETYENRTAKYTPKIGDIVYSREGNYGVCAIIDKNIPIALGQRLVVISPKESILYSPFLYYFLISPFCLDQAKMIQKGMTASHVNVKDIRKFIVPLPPLAEQQRIVSKIEELFAAVDRYGELQKQLADLTVSFPGELRESILQAAMQGKLTEQKTSDGDAADLYEQIQEEKAKLISEGKIKKEKPLPDITEEEIPFDIPENWMWVRLGEIATYIQRGKSPVYSDIKKYPVVAQKCNQWSGFSLEKAKFIDPDTLEKYEPIRILLKDDLLWNSTGLGTVGRMAMYDSSKNPYELAVADSHVTVIRFDTSLVDPKYAYYYFAGPTVQSVIESKTEGSTKQKELYVDTIKKYEFPLPPLAEQQRIVAKIEELFAAIDELDEKIKAF